jgi:transcriptional antiterminator RfaH
MTILLDITDAKNLARMLHFYYRDEIYMSGLDQAPGPQGKWVVVNTHPHKEVFAIDNLQRQNFRSYCPMARKRIRHARREQDVLRPLFPGYIFSQVDTASHRWRSVASTFGVRSLVSFGDRLSFLQDDFIQALMSREVDGAIVRPTTPYVVGQQVRVSGGAFDGIVATIIEMNEKDRFLVLLNLLSRPVRAKLETSNVTAI